MAVGGRQAVGDVGAAVRAEAAWNEAQALDPDVSAGVQVRLRDDRVTSGPMARARPVPSLGAISLPP